MRYGEELTLCGVVAFGNPIVHGCQWKVSVLPSSCHSASKSTCVCGLSASSQGKRKRRSSGCRAERSESSWVSLHPALLSCQRKFSVLAVSCLRFVSIKPGYDEEEVVLSPSITVISCSTSVSGRSKAEEERPIRSYRNVGIWWWTYAGVSQ